jgi:hypothetical protein
MAAPAEFFKQELELSYCRFGRDPHCLASVFDAKVALSLD